MKNILHLILYFTFSKTISSQKVTEPISITTSLRQNWLNVVDINCEIIPECFGLLINEFYVLTSAFCVRDRKCERISFALHEMHETKIDWVTRPTNDNSLSSKPNTKEEFWRKIKRCTVHPEYQGLGELFEPNDVAVLELEDPIIFTHFHIRKPVISKDFTLRTHCKTTYKSYVENPLSTSFGKRIFKEVTFKGFLSCLLAKRYFESSIVVTCDQVSIYTVILTDDIKNLDNGYDNWLYELQSGAPLVCNEQVFGILSKIVNVYQNKYYITFTVVASVLDFIKNQTRLTSEQYEFLGSSRKGKGFCNFVNIWILFLTVVITVYFNKF